MATNVNDIIKKLGSAQRKKMERRAAQLIAEEMTLRELRQARKLTQVNMARKLGIIQDSVSRLEHSSVKVTGKHCAPWVHARQRQLEESLDRAIRTYPLARQESARGQKLVRVN